MYVYMIQYISLAKSKEEKRRKKEILRNAERARDDVSRYIRSRKQAGIDFSVFPRASKVPNQVSILSFRLEKPCPKIRSY